MGDGNPIYFLPDSRDHPLVRSDYAICTDPILEMCSAICRWIDSRAPGGYIYGFSRFGKTCASKRWILKLLAERYAGALACFLLIYSQHDRFSEALFLSELLGACGHLLERAISKKAMYDRLVRLFATAAEKCGGNQIILIVDEAQEMHQPEYQALCNLQNQLESIGYKLTVISVGSHELNYQHQIFVETGKIHLTARFMLRHSRFRGIRSRAELGMVLQAYDILAEWPENSGRTYTSYFFPLAFESGYRMGSHAGELWNIFVDRGPHKRNYSLEVPMEFIAKSVEDIFRNFSDKWVCSHGINQADLSRAVQNSEYEQHMAAISYMLKDEKREPRQ